MANDLIFNPLLKKGFQETSNTGSIEAEIDDLRQQKITKCLKAADLNKIVENETFQWQGNNETIQNTSFINDYFYKKILLTETIIAPVTRLRVFVETDNDFNYNGIQYAPGDYWCKSSNYNNLSKNYRYISPTTSLNGLVCTVVEDNADWMTPGTLFKRINNGICENLILSNAINHGSGHVEVNFTDGSSFYFNGYASQSLNIYFSSYNQSGFVFNFATDTNNDNVGFICCYLDNQNNITDWVPLHCFKSTYNQNVQIKEEKFNQRNTQPPTPGITEENGTLKVSLPVEFDEDVTVKGTQTVVHTQEIESENDFITLRADNPLPLGNNETSGISVNNYDGNNIDCILAVDKDGWARVGDSSGTLEKIATIEETPTDAQFVQYDAQNKQLKTAAIPEATTTDAGLMSVADKLKLNSFGNDLWQDITPTLINSFTGTAKIIQYGRFVNIYITFSNTNNVKIKSRIMEIPILCNAISFNYVFFCYSGDDTIPPIPILLGRQNDNITIYLAENYNANNTYTGAFLVLN